MHRSLDAKIQANALNMSEQVQMDAAKAHALAQAKAALAGASDSSTAANLAGAVEEWPAAVKGRPLLPAGKMVYGHAGMQVLCFKPGPPGVASNIPAALVSFM